MLCGGLIVQCWLISSVHSVMLRCAVLQRKVDSSLLDLQRQNDKLKEKLASASSKVCVLIHAEGCSSFLQDRSEQLHCSSSLARQSQTRPPRILNGLQLLLSAALSCADLCCAGL